MKQPIYSKASLESFAADQMVMEEVIRKLDNQELNLKASLQNRLDPRLLQNRGFGTQMESVATRGVATPGAFNVYEAIVLATGRPPLFVKNDKYVDPEIEELKNRLKPHRRKLNKAIKSVARLEILNHASFNYLGTAWMIDEDIMITNRHVVELFTFRRGKKLHVRTDPFGDTFKTQVDFREEYEQTLAPFEVKIKEILHVEKSGSKYPDVALFRVEKNKKLPKPIKISSNPPSPLEDICVIGYPQRDGLRNDASIMSDLFDDIYQVKRLSPGRVSEIFDDTNVFAHDCTTLGGNSGSVVIRNPTGEALGLHFSGSFMNNNFAVAGSTILKILDKVGTTSLITIPNQVRGKEEAPPTVKDMSDRRGYDSKFLDETVPLPDMLDGHEKFVTTLKRSKKTELKYTHYSVKMHNKRKMPIYTAVNIDGATLFQIKRGSDKWNFDPRISKDLQAGNDFYKGNNMHRGHLVRRLDPVWGATRSIAKKAEIDTFFWTNCTPQHEKFNPKSWLNLEDYILGNADENDLRVSVFTGPVFRHTDLRYRGLQIPADYWKVIAFMHPERGELSATSYLLSQSEFLDDVEFAYGEYRTYQVPIQKIMELTHIDFNHLVDFDPLAKNESVPYLEIYENEEMIL